MDKYNIFDDIMDEQPRHKDKRNDKALNVIIVIVVIIIIVLLIK